MLCLKLAIDGWKYVQFSRDWLYFNQCVAVPAQQKLIVGSTSVEVTCWKMSAPAAIDQFILTSVDVALRI